MSPKKSGTLFIVLMISLVAFGVASTMNIANIGTNLDTSLIPSNLTMSSPQQITTIGDPSFQPDYITNHIIINTTNTTNKTNNTTVIPTNNTSGNSTNTG